MFRPCILAATAIPGATAVLAQDATQEFTVAPDEQRVACATCHEKAGDGNGKFATTFRRRVQNQTAMARHHDGVLPLPEVMQTIDGRALIRGHGNPMPAFATRDGADAQGEDGYLGSDAAAGGRVLDLALDRRPIQA